MLGGGGVHRYKLVNKELCDIGLLTILESNDIPRNPQPKLVEICYCIELTSIYYRISNILFLFRPATTMHPLL